MRTTTLSAALAVALLAGGTALAAEPPDLVIRDARIALAQVCQPGQPVLLVTATVTNIGRGPSPRRVDVGLVGAYDGDGSGWGNGTGLPELKVGESTTVTFPVYYLMANPAHMVATHPFKIVLNKNHWIAESNEANNTFGPVSVTVPPAFCRVAMPLPDLTSRGGMAFGSGGRFVPWGGTVYLSEAEAFRVSGGRCAFYVTYDMTNDGAAAARPAFDNRIRSDAELVAQQTGLTLDAGETRRLTTVPYLAPGRHVVSLSLDDGRAVTESNEGNNRFSVTAVLDADCR